MNKKIKQVSKLCAVVLTASIVLISCTPAKKEYSSELSVEEVIRVVDDVAQWQVREYSNMDKKMRPVWKSHNDLAWNNGVFLYALAEWAEVNHNLDFVRWYEGIAKKNYWQLGADTMYYYHADRMAVCLLYAKLYEKYKNPAIIYPTLATLEFIANHPSSVSLNRDNDDLIATDRWSWCDALYMAPPVYAAFANISGNDRLRDFMDREYDVTYEYLYDKEEKLFYRDSKYFNQREKNGEKVFWGRGNGWVVGGLALLIPQLPDSFAGKEKYITLFREMMERIASLQGEDGYWHASLLDPAAYPNPETSSTGYFTFALWWGINHRILDQDKFLPHAQKGWEALVNAVQPDGMLGWVQPVGQNPQEVTKDMTETYGAAAFMLTGKEIIKYLNNSSLKETE